MLNEFREQQQQRLDHEIQIMSDVQQAVAMEYQRLIQYFSNSNQHPVSQQDAIESIKARKREIENTLRSNVIAHSNDASARISNGSTKSLPTRKPIRY